MAFVENKFSIEGMSCSMCVAHVEKAVQELSLVQHVSVDLVSNTMLVSYDQNLNIKEIIKAVQDAGYEAKLISGNEFATINKSLLKRLMISSFFAILIMIFHFCPLDSFLTKGLLELSITLIVCIINKHFFIAGFKNLFHTPTMDSLIAFGVTAAMGYSIFNLSTILINSSHEHLNLYFDTAVMIQTLILLGKWLEARSKLKVNQSILSLLNMLPPMVTRINQDQDETVPLSSIMVKDLIKIKPGERLAVDGVVIEGNSTVDESIITGESLPINKTKGSKLYAGSLNQVGSLIMEVSTVGADTTVAKIVDLMHKAAMTKAPLTKTVDRVSTYFVPTIIIISLITFIVWYLLDHNLTNAFLHGISVLVVSCPCALGLATPLSIVVAMGIGAKNGLLFKTSAALENLAKTKCFVFDKTGTITTGNIVVKDLEIYNELSSSQFLKIVASLEANSEHPLAKAIVSYAKEHNINTERVEQFSYQLSHGVAGQIDHIQYFIGNPKYIEQNCKGFKDHNEQELIFTTLLLATSDQVLGKITLADQIRPTIKDTIKSLPQSYMLTGDRKAVATHIAHELNMPEDHIFAEQLPSDKVQNIQKLKKDGLVTMVGDGMNDAPALMEADLGIAIGSGTDLTKNAADLILVSNEPLDLLKAIKLSHATIRNIYENLFWCFIYNISCIPIAAGCLESFNIQFTPIMAAAAMSISSLCVVTNALRLKL